MKDHKKVILFESATLTTPQKWEFSSVETENGRDIAVTWDAEETFEARQAFESMIKNCRAIENHLVWPNWRHKMRDEAGKMGLVELGFKADGRPYRALVKFSGRKAIILCVCFHKGNVWTPPDAIKVAVKRAKSLSDGKVKLNVIKIEDD